MLGKVTAVLRTIMEVSSCQFCRTRPRSPPPPRQKVCVHGKTHTQKGAQGECSPVAVGRTKDCCCHSVIKLCLLQFSTSFLCLFKVKRRQTAAQPELGKREEEDRKKGGDTGGYTVAI